MSFPWRGMQQVMSQNGPIVVDITAFQLAQACGTLKMQATLEVSPTSPYPLPLSPNHQQYTPTKPATLYLRAAEPFPSHCRPKRTPGIS